MSPLMGAYLVWFGAEVFAVMCLFTFIYFVNHLDPPATPETRQAHEPKAA